MTLTLLDCIAIIIIILFAVIGIYLAKKEKNVYKIISKILYIASIAIIIFIVLGKYGIYKEIEKKTSLLNNMIENKIPDPKGVLLIDKFYTQDKYNIYHVKALKVSSKKLYKVLENPSGSSILKETMKDLFCVPTAKDLRERRSLFIKLYGNDGLEVLDINIDYYDCKMILDSYGIKGITQGL